MKRLDKFKAFVYFRWTVSGCVFKKDQMDTCCCLSVQKLYCRKPVLTVSETSNHEACTAVIRICFCSGLQMSYEQIKQIVISDGDGETNALELVTSTVKI